MFFLYTGNVTTAGNNQLMLSNATSNGTNRSLLNFSEFNAPELAHYRLRCGVRIAIVLATGFIVAIKYYFFDHGQSIEMVVFWSLATLLFFACLYSILCRRSQNHNPQEHQVEEEHIASVTTTSTIPNENILPISILRQNPPPPPYHIAILTPPPHSSEEAPPPSYDKVMR